MISFSEIKVFIPKFVKHEGSPYSASACSSAISTQVLKERRLYLDPLISLEKFAAEVGIPGHVCSRQLQAEKAGGFYLLISEYRIEHARHLLNKDILIELTIEHVAEACGFNSKASLTGILRKLADVPLQNTAERSAIL